MVNVLSQSEYHDLLVPIDRDHLGVAVWLTGMVDEPSLVARHSGIHHFIVIDTEHVTTNALESVKREEGRWRRGKIEKREGGRERRENERKTHTHTQRVCECIQIINKLHL